MRGRVIRIREIDDSANDKLSIVRSWRERSHSERPFSERPSNSRASAGVVAFASANLLSPLFENVGVPYLRRRRSARRIHSPAHLTDDTAPLRAELYSVSQLEQHARVRAGWHEQTSASSSTADRLLPRLDANEQELRRAYGLLTAALLRGKRLTPAAEWFIDNYHLVEEQIRTARRHLPHGYSRELPRLANLRSAGLPRVYDLVLELISHSHGRLDLEGLRAFVSAYQSVQPLKLGELWAIPIMLRIALLENLRRIVAGVTAGRRDRDAAELWVARMVEVSSQVPANLVLVLAEMVEESPPLTTAFAMELATRLQGLGPALGFPMAWLEERLAERGQTVEQIFQIGSQSQAADQVAIGNSIGSLRLLGATDWRDFVEAMSVVERQLTLDPAHVYSTMDFATRDRYRHVVEEIAKGGTLDEAAVASAAVELASAGSARTAHVGYYLIGNGRRLLEQRAHVRATPKHAARALRFPLYAGSIAGITGAASIGIVAAARYYGIAGPTQAMVGALAVIVTSQLSVSLVHLALSLIVRPSMLPRLDYSAGIPPESRTVVAVPTMLTDIAEIDSLLEALEVRYLANRDEHLSFILVSDFRDAASECMAQDAALLQHASAGILALNARYTTAGHRPTFYLLHRPRRWNECQGVWMGWERKRGKLEQLNEALRGGSTAFLATPTDLRPLHDTKYVIVLDSDTELPRDAARTLAATMAHPLNHPRFDAKLARVVEGHAILQPRVAITMSSAHASGFARLFSGEPGIDPYTRAVSDVYQDAFGEGSFVGKGIYDLDAFRQVISGKLPENRILSHDLLEGSYARSGLVSDVLLFEDFPSAYSADVSRRQRWTRGDWQLTGWLRSTVPNATGDGRVINPLSRLSQWKVLDNLRRSLVPPAMFALLLLGWRSTATAGPTMLVVALILSVPGLIGTAAGLARRPRELPRRSHGRALALDLALQLAREAVALVCLPYEAWLSADAIVRSGFRVHVTRRKLLEWRTASDAQRAATGSLADAYRRMAVAPIAALGTACWLMLGHRAVLPWAAPILVLWLLAPSVTWWLGRPRSVERARLTPGDLAFLRLVARKTWRFFETFIGASDNYLPPDNYQQEPEPRIAHRTSPTNIGLSLTATLAARDFGYVSTGQVLERTAQTLATMERLERYRGHFYNWYDTQTLEPLRPRYISTVDSGNLAGHLLTLASGLREFSCEPIFSERVFLGLRDTLAVLAGTIPDAQKLQRHLAGIQASLENPPQQLSSAYLLLERLLLAGVELLSLLELDANDEALIWGHCFEHQVQDGLSELRLVAPWLSLTAPSESVRAASALIRLTETPSLLEVARLTASPTSSPLTDELDETDRTFLDALHAAIALGASAARLRLERISRLAQLATELAALDYEFLYDRERHLLAIGYSVGDHRLDASFYDLLASEARLTSFVAIAQGKLPEEHWFSLGRSLTTTSGTPALLSWSGSMFEYLMPLLIMPTYRGTILDETYRGVVARQLEYGRERGVPWGISESGYSKTDAQLNYQYRAFGVPGLGFKRGLADDLVIAPYASAMALMVAPEAACQNLRRLADEGQLGPKGFYEAVDYTTERLPRGKDSVTVESYMAHHQGMTFLSLVYLLCDRPMQRRFDADPAFRATDLLLQERVPRVPAIYPHPAEVSAAAQSNVDTERNLRVFTTPNTSSPQVQLLSNGSYHVMVTNAGGGYSRWRDLAVTRWIEDPTRDNWGSFCYLRDVASGVFWSVAHQPTLVPATSYEAIFSQGRAEFRRHDGEIDTHVEISVSPEDDVELRRVSLTNFGRNSRKLELTSFAEVVLTTPAADLAHPAFSNLFVQSEFVRPRQAILCTRRPRSGSEKPPWMFHLMTVQGRVSGTPSFETGRAEFIGRNRTVADPQAMHCPRLSDSEGSVLDPVVAIRNVVLLDPDETVRIHLVTGVSETREGALALIEKYSDGHSADRVFELSWTHSQVVLRRLDVSEADTQLYERLAGHVLYANPTLRAPRNVLARNHRDQSALWAYAISGDLPICLVKIADRQFLGLVRQLVQAHAYFRLKGVAADLVIWNDDPSGYRQVLQEEIRDVIASLGQAERLDRSNGIFLCRTDQISEEDKVLLQTVARLVLVDSDGTLAEQINRLPPIEPRVPWFAARERRAEPRRGTKPSGQLARPDLASWNGRGGFTPDGREYVMVTHEGARTPAPWVNVLANPYFGSIISESGSAYSWSENAHNYRLTPWHNDPITDPSGEAFYVRDEDTGHFWSPTPMPAGGTGPYTTRHGFGYSVFEYREDGIESELRTFVATDAPLKFVLFKLTNRSNRPRRLSLTGLFELVLGESRAKSFQHVVTELDAGSGAIIGRNPYGNEFARRVAFLDCSEELRSITGDRLEFVGRNGSLARPACLKRTWLSGRVGPALDPCMAMQVMVELAAGEEHEVAFTFGSGFDLADAQTLIHRFRGVGAARSALDRVWDYWNHTLGAIHVQTPDPALNFLTNGWLIYQVLSARLWGRSGFYQSGGAFGFRDQLQDAMSLVHAAPAILREQLVRSSERQFREGDVQHWWHPPMGRGVRTRISDDYLWLPYATCRYIETLGDVGVLSERTAFLEGRPVKPDEDSYYDLPLRSEETGTLYEHCVRAIENGLRVGVHGLPLMGTGDWNDGMNLVGERGEGESVWLAFFLHDVLVRFVKIARLQGDEAFAERCLAAAAGLTEAISQHGWDGQWYRRAYFDDGEALGTASGVDCQIDSLPQSWATLSQVGSPERAKTALASLDARLVDRELGLIRLFDPPFDRSDSNPGYVKGYVPGVRENGGQYTHAAVWAVMAFAASGNSSKAWELFGLINPVRHGGTQAAIERYKVEPYVMAADVYTNPKHAGRGGWTWYTGAAGWMYRLAVESLLGVRLEVDRLFIEPLMPSDWTEFELHYRYRSTRYHIRVHGPQTAGSAVSRLVCYGAEQSGGYVPLRDDGGEHDVELWLASEGSCT